MHHNYLGTEHLLLALLRETDGVADQILLEMGLSLADLRLDVLKCLGESSLDEGRLGPLPPEAAHVVEGAQGTLPPRAAGLVKHLVMWRLPNEDPDKTEKARKIKSLLEQLPPKVPVLRHLEVGINQVDGAAACDVVLFTAFDSFDDLNDYRDHPEHKRVAAEVSKMVSERYVVDYQG